MRKTLHALPPQVAAIALAATRHYRLRDTANLVKKAGLAQGRFSAAQRWLLGVLGVGWCSHRELEALAVPHGWQTVEIRLALKWCWESGEVVYRNSSPSWHREVRQFRLTRCAYPTLTVNREAEASKDELITLYFDRYGPATLSDAAWWSGLGRQRIFAALGQAHIVQLGLPWARSPFYMLRERFEEFQMAPRAWMRSGINYLAHEDVALKAYYESRGRYLGQLRQRAAFNQIGEALPTIVCDGQVVGLWRWDHSRRTVLYRHFPEANLSLGLRSESGQHARRLRDRLRQGYER
jgi:hypothetical protein